MSVPEYQMGLVDCPVHSEVPVLSFPDHSFYNYYKYTTKHYTTVSITYNWKINFLLQVGELANILYIYMQLHVGRVKSAYESSGLSGWSLSWFKKHMCEAARCIFTPSGWDASTLQGHRQPPSLNSPVPIYTPKVRSTSLSSAINVRCLVIFDRLINIRHF